MPLDIRVIGFFYSLQRIIESYEGLFQSGDIEMQHLEEVFEKWNWYQSIYTVARCLNFQKQSLDIHSFLTF
jgi:hypothetical protein